MVDEACKKMPPKKIPIVINCLKGPGLAMSFPKFQPYIYHIGGAVL